MYQNIRGTLGKVFFEEKKNEDDETKYRVPYLS